MGRAISHTTLVPGIAGVCDVVARVIIAGCKHYAHKAQLDRKEKAERLVRTFYGEDDGPSRELTEEEEAIFGDGAGGVDDERFMEYAAGLDKDLPDTISSVAAGRRIHLDYNPFPTKVYSVEHTRNHTVIVALIYDPSTNRLIPIQERLDRGFIGYWPERALMRCNTRDYTPGVSTFIQKLRDRALAAKEHRNTRVFVSAEQVFNIGTPYFDTRQEGEPTQLKQSEIYKAIAREEGTTVEQMKQGKGEGELKLLVENTADQITEAGKVSEVMMLHNGERFREFKLNVGALPATICCKTAAYPALDPLATPVPVESVDAWANGIDEWKMALASPQM